MDSQIDRRTDPQTEPQTDKMTHDSIISMLAITSVVVSKALSLGSVYTVANSN